MKLRQAELVAALILLFAPVSALATETWQELLDRADSLLATGQSEYANAVIQTALPTALKNVTKSETSVGVLLHITGSAEIHQFSSYAAAESLLSRVLTIKEQALSTKRPDVATVLSDLADLYSNQTRYAEAATLYQRALVIREEALGPEDLAVAQSLQDLATLYYLLVKYAEAEPLYIRAAAIREEVLGPEHPDVAESLFLLAVLYMTQGRNAEAEPLSKEALAIRERKLGPQHPLVAQSLSNLGALYYEQARYNEAETLTERALAIREKTLGPEDVAVAGSINNLAAICIAQGRLAEAEPLCKRALAIREKVLGPGDPYSIYSLTNLVDLYYKLGRYAEAELLCRQALAIGEEALGPEHPLVATSLAHLANLCYAQNRLADAESLYTRALAVREKAFGPVHPQVASSMEDLSRYYRGVGDIGTAQDLAVTAFRIRQSAFVENAMVLSEKDALTYAQLLRASAYNCFACYHDIAFPDSTIERQTADIIIASKGGVSDGIFERQRTLVEETDATTLALAEALRYTKFRLSQLFVEGPGEDPEGYRLQVDSLTTEAKDLEADLARHSASFKRRQETEDIDVAKVTSLLPGNSVLVEYVRYDYTALNPERTVPGYIAAVLVPGREPAIIELGEASEIDALVEAWRSHMLRVASSGRPPSIVDQKEYERLSRDLYEEIWRPVESYAEDSELVLVAPDGALNMVAFAGLKAPDGEYLIEEYALHHLSAGRDLVRLGHAPESAAGLFALGDPDYGASASKRLAAVSEPEDSAIQVAWVTRNIRSSCGAISEAQVTPLPGTRREVELISKSWEEATLGPVVTCYGDEASEEVFKAEAPGKRVIHLATHGYFLGAACHPEGAGSDYVGENPLLLSGLFLAGANLHGRGADSAGAEDGILTAHEVSAMDLKGTELVVLSACETGLGEVAEGEGVYGLRRAFQMAGARTVVSALWPVSDEATAQMMGRLYARADETLPEAMRRIQLERLEELRSNDNVDHPYIWSPFVALGDWR